MGQFLSAAYQVLKEKGQPLSALEITREALARGILATTGLTPSQTMKSKLSTDILRRRDKSLFMRSDQGTFALREWNARITEHTADRYQKALFDEDIVVFPLASLTTYVPTPGLWRGPLDSAGLLSELRPLRRREAEEDTTVVQLVSVFVIRHKNRILTHKRTKRLPESRLHGYYSIGFGGHLNPDDVPPLLDIFDPSLGLPFLLRELNEELRLPRENKIQMSYRGLLYDPSRDVSKQHLGIVYEAEVSLPVFEIGERGFLMDAKYETVAQMERRISDFENWSAMLIHTLGALWS